MFHNEWEIRSIWFHILSVKFEQMMNSLKACSILSMYIQSLLTICVLAYIPPISVSSDPILLSVALIWSISCDNLDITVRQIHWNKTYQNLRWSIYRLHTKLLLSIQVLSKNKSLSLCSNITKSSTFYSTKLMQKFPVCIIPGKNPDNAVQYTIGCNEQ